MKIEEQIHNALSDSNVSWGETKQVLESILEDAAISFGTWLQNNTVDVDGLVYTLNVDSKAYSVKELFELFKKENNL